MEGSQRYFGTRVLAFAILVLAFLALFPAFASAKDELDTTIRAIIMSDPNSAALSEAQLDALTTELAERARQDGVTLGDIVWRPETPVTEEEATSLRCGNVPAFLCVLNEAFGFSGNDLTLPIGFFLTSIVLLFLLWAMINSYRHRMIPPPAAWPSANPI